jgi:hypothetical protein
MAGGVRVGVAFDATTLEPSPTWTYLTDTSNLVAGYEIDRGRQYEFDKTDTGTATVTLFDQDGVLDPTNASGPYFGKIDPLLQIKVDLWNPVISGWVERFRGFILEYDYSVQPWAYQDGSGNTVGVTSLTLSCADLFAILDKIEMYPDLVSSAPAFGDPPPTASAGNVFFDNASAHDRIEQVLGNAGIDPAFYVVFTLNVNLQETVYSPGQSVLEVIQEAADAEFPTVSNVYCDRLGRVAVHGRLAKFTPSTVAAGAGTAAWDFTQWKAGDGKAVAASPSDTAHIRTFAFNRGWSKVFNYAYCSPKDIADADIAGQVSRDATSIGDFGYCPWSAESLIIGAPTGDPLTGADADTLTGLDALAACKTFADYIVANYKTPRDRITEITFRSIDPLSTGASANWDLLTRADISDQVVVTVRGPGDGPAGAIFNGATFFIEGLRETVAPLNGTYGDVTLSLDLSPAAYYTPGSWTGD